MQREPHPFCPYLYLHNISYEQLAVLKNELYKENVNFSDGFPFLGADFYANTLALPVNHKNMLQIKIINEMDMINSVIESVRNRIEIYQFYKEKVFYKSVGNVKHIKILIEKLENIKEII